MFNEEMIWLGLHLTRRAGRRLLPQSSQAGLPRPELLGSAETLECRPAQFDFDTLSRIISCGFGQSIDQQVGKLTQTTLELQPMELYHMGKACIVGGTIESRARSHLLVGTPISRCLGKKLRYFETLCVANTMQGLRYFGHWLRDDCVAYEKLQDYGEIRSLRRPVWSDCDGYERLFEQDWQEVDFAVAENLILQREIGFNRDKALRISLLRDRIRQKLKAPNEGNVVYLARGPSGEHRNPLNENQLKTELSTAGVRIVTPESGAEETITQLLDARIVITVEGSQATHAVFSLKQGGSLIVLQPPRRFYNPHIEWTRLINIDYAIVIGEDQGPDEGFNIHSDEVLGMVDRLLDDECVVI